MTTELWRLLLMNSYLRKEQAPAYLKRLGTLAVRNVTVKGDRGIGFDTNFIDIFPEILSAYGFMMLARDEVRKWQAQVPDNEIFARYHFYAFVFNTKSYLDKVALFLNAQYDLRFAGGSIDLRRPDFLEGLERKRRAVAHDLRRLAGWYVRVSEWRDQMIHREGISATSYFLTGKKYYKKASRQIWLPKRPESITGKSRGGHRMPSFCEAWLRNAEYVLRIVSDDAIKVVQKRWPVHRPSK